jgi:chromosome segregation ATPase
LITKSSELSEEQRQKEQIQTQLQTLQTEHQDSLSTVQSLQKQVEDKETNLQELQLKNEQLASQLITSEERAKSLESQLKEISSEGSQKGGLINELQDKLATSTQLHKETQDQLHILQEKVSSLTAQIESQEASIAAHKENKVLDDYSRPLQ